LNAAHDGRLDSEEPSLDGTFVSAGTRVQPRAAGRELVDDDEAVNGTLVRPFDVPRGQRQPREYGPFAVLDLQLERRTVLRPPRQHALDVRFGDLLTPRPAGLVELAAEDAGEIVEHIVAVDRQHGSSAAQQFHAEFDAEHVARRHERTRDPFELAEALLVARTTDPLA